MSYYDSLKMWYNGIPAAKILKEWVDDPLLDGEDGSPEPDDDLEIEEED